jgi:hypothetical protein
MTLQFLANFDEKGLNQKLDFELEIYNLSMSVNLCKLS